MIDIKKSDVLTAIVAFLAIQREKKLVPARKKLAHAESAGNLNDIEAERAHIEKVEGKYSKDAWMQDEAQRMARQLRFGTHISKGVHPDSKGSNVTFFSGRKLPAHLVGSQTLPSLPLDANGNAAALPLASFLNFDITETGDVKIRDLLRAEHPALDGVFSDDQVADRLYAHTFTAALLGLTGEPKSDERNKQVLWPVGSTSEQDYLVLAPLYPSALTHVQYHRIKNARYSDENKQAKENRRKSSVEQQEYVTIGNLAMTKLGGSKPQNVSQLVSSQGGRQYLLPSVPPSFTERTTFLIRKSDQTIFNRRLQYRSSFGLQMLFDVLDSNKNTVAERDQRKAALDLVLKAVLETAQQIQRDYPVGWSPEYRLSLQESYWLDPGREALDGAELFAQGKAETDWITGIQHDFARWINEILRVRYPKTWHQFTDAEHMEWFKSIEAAIKASERSGVGVFQ